MVEIERKALQLVKEVECERVGSVANTHYTRSNNYVYDALCRAIEQHEAFRQEVSDVVTECATRLSPHNRKCLSRFIIAKPDPLVEALRDTYPDASIDDKDAKYFRSALAKRGLEIREKSND